MAKEGDRQLLLGPVIDKDGNVTFKAIHEKEQLYLLGSFHEWNAMSLDEGYQTLVNYQRNVKRILTSGGKANCEAGKEQLAKLVTSSQRLQGPVIMRCKG